MYGVASRRGRRRTNREDTYTTLPFAANADSTSPVSLFGVYDGHGGQKAAKYASERIPQLALTASDFESSRLRAALREAFKVTDTELISEDFDAALGKSQSLAEGRLRSGGSRFASVALQNIATRQPSHDNKTKGEVVSDMPSACAPTPHGNSSRAATFGAALSRSNSRAEDHVSVSATRKAPNCGTTATVVVLVGLDLYCAHVGDTRAVLCCNGQAVRLTDDHRPCRMDEMERIESAGGLILTVAGTSRVNGILAVSRALGDPELKEFVIGDPDLSSRELACEDDFLIIASDGLWDMVEDQEVVDMTQNLLRRAGRGLEHVAKSLVLTACDRGSNDDVSVLIVDLQSYFDILRDQPNQTDSDDQMVEEEVVEVSFSDLSLCEQGVPVMTNQCDPMPTPRVRKKSAW